MSSKVSPGSVAGLIMTALAVAFGLYQYSSVKSAEAALATAAREHQADQARLQELTKKAREAVQNEADLQRQLQQQRLAAAENAAAAAGPAARAPQPVQDPRAAKAAALADGQAFLASYGQSRDMLMAIGKAQIGRNYAGFFRAAGLSQNQIDELENQTAAFWIETIAVAPGNVHPGTPELPDDQIKTILGEQAFQQFQDYRRIQPLQGMVNDISSLAPSAPLSPEQSNQLLNIMAGASAAYQNGGKADPQAIDWNQVLVQSQGVLTEAQVTALKAEAQLPQVMSLVKQFYQSKGPAK